MKIDFYKKDYFSLRFNLSFIIQRKTREGITIKDVMIKKIAQSLCIFSGVFKKASLSTTNQENEENIFFPNVANEAIKA